MHADHQGSIIAISDSTGNHIQINTYDAYGIPQNDILGRFTYTGQIYLPEIDLYHYKARVYHPKLGRFLQTDPVGYEDQMNLYAYVGNDPYNNNDPSGEIATKALELSGRAGWAIGVGINTAVKHFAGVTLSYMIMDAVWNAVHDESSDPLDSILTGTEPGNDTKGRSKTFDKPGDFDNDALGDYGELVPDGGEIITDSKGGEGLQGTDSKGRKVNVRPNSSDGRPTLEVKDGKNRTKIRYGDREQ